jgi:hypothetical protein
VISYCPHPPPTHRMQGKSSRSSHDPPLDMQCSRPPCSHACSMHTPPTGPRSCSSCCDTGTQRIQGNPTISSQRACCFAQNDAPARPHSSLRHSRGGPTGGRTGVTAGGSDAWLAGVASAVTNVQHRRMILAWHTSSTRHPGGTIPSVLSIVRSSSSHDLRQEATCCTTDSDTHRQLRQLSPSAQLRSGKTSSTLETEDASTRGDSEAGLDDDASLDASDADNSSSTDSNDALEDCVHLTSVRAPIKLLRGYRSSSDCVTAIRMRSSVPHGASSSTRNPNRRSPFHLSVVIGVIRGRKQEIVSPLNEQEESVSMRENCV